MKWIIKIIILGLFIISGCNSSEVSNEDQGFDINSFIQENYGGCLSPFDQKNPYFCKDIVFVDCGSAVDGPSYYLNKNTGELISTCGGACWGATGEGRRVCETLCPPPEWDCQ